MKGKSGEKVKSTNQTQNQFSGKYKKGFFVLPDIKTIVGVSDNNVNTLFTEDITTNKVTPFGKHKQSIYTLLYDKVTESLFAGDSRGHVVQYKRGSNTSAFSLVKDYGNVDINEAFSCVKVGEYAVFSGFDIFFVAINIRERRVCKEKIKSPFKYIYSLEVCHALDQKVYLSIGAENPNYSWKLTDLLDVTEIYNKKKKSNKSAEKMIKHKKDDKKKKLR